MEEMFEFFAEVKWETDAAYLFSDGGNEFWCPKSQILEMERSGDGYDVKIPEWLAIEKGIV